MEEKELWGVTKTMKKTANPDLPKNWLNKTRELWVGFVDSAASFTDKGEARKALNKKLSLEITHWGLGHVHRWAYKTERINK